MLRIVSRDIDEAPAVLFRRENDHVLAVRPGPVPVRLLRWLLATVPDDEDCDCGPDCPIPTMRGAREAG